MARLIRALVLLVIGAMIAAIALLGDWPFWGDSEQRAITLERATRRGYWATGRTLPGTPDLAKLPERLAAGGFALGQPILVRVFKREFELEIWMRRGDRYALFATYPVCRWSGRLGPKLQRGDKQAPEGFYTVGASQLNPNSRWHRSFNIGFPNAYDRLHGRTGDFLMVHGGCGSVGCYAMTNAVIDEIWTLVTAALGGGQGRFQVQAYPFRMTEENLARHATSPNAAFWRSLKDGHDRFLADGVPPVVEVCGGSYAFRSGGMAAARSARPIAACATPAAKSGTAS
jgi:murein L,D-transpeptidase YafK